MKPMRTDISNTLPLLLAALLFVSCAEGGGETSDTQVAANDGTTAAVTEAAETDFFSDRNNLSDDLPESDFGGKAFRIITQGQLGYTAEQDGDIVNDAIYFRNLTVSKRFNTVIEEINTGDYTVTKSNVSQSVKAGDDSYDLVSFHGIEMGNLALEDNFLNWYDIPHVNFEKPWWSATTREDLSFNGVCPLAIGDLALMSIGQTICTYFNSTMANDYDIPDLYEMAENGTWTYDKLISLAKDIYVDNNLDGKVDSGDTFGVSLDAKNRINMFYWAFDNPLMAVTDDKIEITYRTEKMVDFITALNNDFRTNIGCALNAAMPDGGMPSFDGGNVLFHFDKFSSASWMRDMEDDFGILPLPKWDEAQDSYHTYASGSAPLMAVPITVSDLEMIGTVTEALNAESYKQVTPVYYETALKEKYARDEKTVGMIDLVMKGRVVDMGFVYDGFLGAGYIPATLVQKNDSNVESYLQKNEKKINARYEQVITYFTEYHDNH